MGPAPARLYGFPEIISKTSSLLFCQNFSSLLSLGKMLWAGRSDRFALACTSSCVFTGFPTVLHSAILSSPVLSMLSSVDCFCFQGKIFPKLSLIKESMEGWFWDGWEAGLSRTSVRPFQLRQSRVALNNITFPHKKIPHQIQIHYSKNEIQTSYSIVKWFKGLKHK